MDILLSGKEKSVDKEYCYCKEIIEKKLIGNNVAKAMAAISVASSLLYEWNQRYTDDYLETAVSMVAQTTSTDEIHNMKPRKNTVLFYDGFGLDTRGLALIYLKALVHSKWKIYYVVPYHSKRLQPQIDKIIDGKNIEKIYCKHSKHEKKLKELQQIFCCIKPEKAFLYTSPYDVASIVAFMQMENVVKYQINLTDHAFWLGIHAFDYCLEYRNYGASISFNERGIKRSQIIMLPYYPVLDKDVAFQGFPFEAEGKKIIFSGGALYKTIDKNRTYYKIVSLIMEDNPDTVFLYAGVGDDTYLKELMVAFPERVFHIEERTDLYQIMIRVTLYLSTYPMAGGLMLQYAAVAGKLPISLRHGNDNGGVLINQDKLGIEYNSLDELVKDVNRLLSDDDYRKKRELLLEGCVISESAFEDELLNIVEYSYSKYNSDLLPIDTTQFRKEFAERFDLNSFKTKIANRSNVALLREYGEAYYDKIREGILRGLRSRL